MKKPVTIGDRRVGEGEPCYVIAEIGINHNGDLGVAKRLIDAAALAGCDAVKFQKRTPELCVPKAQRSKRRETPWGEMSYMEYRERVEFGEEEFGAIDAYCRDKGIHWFASAWDPLSVDFLARFEAPAFKIPSALLTDHALLAHHRAATEAPIILSTGMSTMVQIEEAVAVLGTDNLVLTHCTSAYPCPPHELNLRMIATLREAFGVPVGYSGHEVGLATSVVAAALGACLVERHITLDRAMWGSDQAASVEPHGFARMVRDIRTVEAAMGDGVKQVYESEIPILHRLRPAATSAEKAGGLNGK